MFCPHCGAPMNDGAAFCPVCGQHAAAPVQQASIQAAVPQATASQDPVYAPISQESVPQVYASQAPAPQDPFAAPYTPPYAPAAPEPAYPSAPAPAPYAPVPSSSSPYMPSAPSAPGSYIPAPYVPAPYPPSPPAYVPGQMPPPYFTPIAVMPVDNDVTRKTKAVFRSPLFVAAALLAMMLLLVQLAQAIWGIPLAASLTDAMGTSPGTVLFSTLLGSAPSILFALGMLLCWVTAYNKEKNATVGLTLIKVYAIIMVVVLCLAAVAVAIGLVAVLAAWSSLMTQLADNMVAGSPRGLLVVVMVILGMALAVIVLMIVFFAKVFGLSSYASHALQGGVFKRRVPVFVAVMCCLGALVGLMDAAAGLLLPSILTKIYDKVDVDFDTALTRYIPAIDWVGLITGVLGAVLLLLIAIIIFKFKADVEKQAAYVPDGTSPETLSQ